MAKMRKPFQALVALSLPLMLLAGCAQQSVKAVKGPDGVQTARIVVKDGYHPSEVVAKGGEPLRLVFFRDEPAGGHSCGEELMVPAENVKLKLPPGQTQIVELKAQPAGGEVPFECGMKMMKGRVRFE